MFLPFLNKGTLDNHDFIAENETRVFDHIAICPLKVTSNVKCTNCSNTLLSELHAKKGEVHWLCQFINL